MNFMLSYDLNCLNDLNGLIGLNGLNCLNAVNDHNDRNKLSVPDNDFNDSEFDLDFYLKSLTPDPHLQTLTR